MNDEFRQFVLNNAVHSKLSERVLVKSYNKVPIVFIHGFPMTLRGFYTLTSKALLGSAMRIAVRVWKEIHHETLVLSEGLSLNLREGREAYSVMLGIRKAANWSKDTYDRKRIMEWIAEVERQIDEQLER